MWKEYFWRREWTWCRTNECDKGHLPWLKMNLVVAFKEGEKESFFVFSFTYWNEKEKALAGIFYFQKRVQAAKNPFEANLQRK